MSLIHYLLCILFSLSSRASSSLYVCRYYYRDLDNFNVHSSMHKYTSIVIKLLMNQGKVKAVIIRVNFELACARVQTVFVWNLGLSIFRTFRNIYFLLVTHLLINHTHTNHIQIRSKQYFRTGKFLALTMCDLCITYGLETRIKTTNLEQTD